jgi:putative intracellular protease/amidase
MNYAISHEVSPMLKMLKDGGYQAYVATETGSPIGTGTSILRPNTKLSEVDVNKYVGLIIPCMADPGPPFSVPNFSMEIAKKMYDKGLPIAAQQSGVEILAKAGLLDGKRYASAEVNAPKGSKVFEDVVQDGQIITSTSCPFYARMTGAKDDTSELITEFKKMLRSSK